MENKVINVYKKCGETPLDCINKLKKDDSSLRFLPMTYAGRLDPLAEGVLLILVGEECHQKEKYLNLEKVYEVDVLFGFATDTYDVMGKVTETVESIDVQRLRETLDVCSIKKVLPEFIGKIKQSYPPYSSRPVKGKPLFMWAREGKLDEIEIPSHDVFVENIEIIGQSEILGKFLLEKIKEDIAKVNGDFRQEEILKIWESELKKKEEEKYFVIKLRISCGSGAYMRSIANDIGVTLGIPALALKIIRTKIGEYRIN
jgi:tRNA pseudouridine55 synthase